MARLTAMIALAAFLAAGPGVAQLYRIQAGDTLDVSVLEDPAISRQVLVRPDGRISLPLAGTVEAAGRTLEEVEALLRSRFARDFVTPPTVTVALLGRSPEAPSEARIYVIGSVRSPGAFDVKLPMTVLQALALSGGVDIFAATRRIHVRRRTASIEQVLNFDYEGILDGRVPSGVFELVDGDVIVVPESGLFE